MRYLITSYYDAKNKERQKEIDHCVLANMSSGLFDKIILLSEPQTGDVGLMPDVPADMKVCPVVIGVMKRPSFVDFFRTANDFVKKGDICIVANTDMMFDQTIKLCDDMKDDECYALSRWDLDVFHNPIPYQAQVFGDSQDVWVFKGTVKGVSHMFLDYPMGKMGCDNRLAYELHNSGYIVTNPSRSVKAWHLHNSNIRNYNRAIRNEETVVPPPYHTVKPSSL